MNFPISTATVDQVGTNGNPYLTGWTNSRNFSVSYGAFQTNRLGNDAFVVKMNPTGTAIGKRQQEPIAEQPTTKPDRGIGVTGEQGYQEQAVELDVSPNPTSGDAQLRLYLSEAMSITVELHSLTGEQVPGLSQTQWYGSGKQSIPLQTDGVPSGMYLVRVVTPTTIKTTLLTIVR